MLGLDSISCRVWERRSCEAVLRLGREANVLLSGFDWVGVEVDMVRKGFMGLYKQDYYIEEVRGGGRGLGD